MAVYVIGDVHGQFDKLLTLLYNAHLVDDHLQWIGGDSTLWFMGDFFDRGTQGIDVVELIMRLQGQAAEVGGAVRALLGNHEVLFMAAHRFPNKRRFVINWRRNGGQESDMQRVTARQIAWLRNLPVLALVENRLFMHADATFYRHYGSSVDEVNARISALLRGDDDQEWDQLLEDFAERMVFAMSEMDGGTNAALMLEDFGGEQIIHGHTPIQYLSEEIVPDKPVIYARELCIDVDGGMYLGGPGFVFRLKA